MLFVSLLPQTCFAKIQALIVVMPRKAVMRKGLDLDGGRDFSEKDQTRQCRHTVQMMK
jgi:hypothetical protein